jgi:AbrB family looped-hinge helix DNA binding protein
LKMKTLATARMSSKGQVVIPEELRNRLGLKTGSQFVVVGENDVVIMKTITQPSMRDFDNLIKKARKQARSAGMTKSDISKAIAGVRGK